MDRYRHILPRTEDRVNERLEAIYREARRSRGWARPCRPCPFRALRGDGRTNRPMRLRPKRLLICGFICGRCWARTSDPCLV